MMSQCLSLYLSLPPSFSLFLSLSLSLSLSLTLFLSISLSLSLVTINGTNLFGYGTNITQVKLGNIIAEILFDKSDSTSIFVRAANSSVNEDTTVFITLIADSHAQVQSSSAIWTYIKEGEITSITPNSGQIGSRVTINGTNLLGGGQTITKMYMDGVEPVINAGYTDNQITVSLGDESLLNSNLYPGEIYIETNTGAIVKGGPFKQFSPGNITTFSPTQGRLGTEITITGYNLTGQGNSIINVSVAGYSVISGTYETTDGDTQLVIQVPNASNGTTGIISLSIDTGAIVKSSMEFTYLQPGEINTVDPDTGTEGRGVFVRGINLKINSLDITSVKIGQAEVQRIVTETNSEVSFIVGPAPESNQTTLPVRITSSDGSYVEGGNFTYQEFALSIFGLAQGQYGTEITLNVPFPVYEVLRVQFDDQDALILKTNSDDSTVTVETPRAQQLGQYTVDVVVEDINNLIARLKNGFTYLSEGVICSVSPLQGQRGTKVSIQGENLLGGGLNISSVSFSDVFAKVEYSSNTSVNVSLMNNLPQSDSYPISTDITLNANTGAMVTSLNAFSLIQPGLITSVSPNFGQYGTLITIEGIDLLQESLELVSVTLVGINAELVGEPNNTFIQVRAASSPAGNGTVSIILSSGAEITSNQSLQFTYLVPGAIDSVTPMIGTEGTMVTIRGSNLLGGGSNVSIVTLDGIAANLISYDIENITVKAGKGNVSAVQGDVVIVSNTGSIVTSIGSWMYEELGNITSITPSSGQQGVIVEINGTSFLGSSGFNVSNVTLAGIQGTILEQNDTMIIVEAKYSETGLTGPVVLYIWSGPVITSSNNWTYYPASLNSITPVSGVNGTYVTLTGTNIVGEPNTLHTLSSVYFGDIPCYDIQIQSQNTVQVRTGFSSNSIGLRDIRITSTSDAYLVLENQWQFNEPGYVTLLSPNSASPGENVTILGNNLVPTNATTVQVVTGETKAFSTEIWNTSAISFRVGVYNVSDEPGTQLPIYIVSNDGSTVFNSTPLFTFTSVSIANSVAPYAGENGVIVVINGTHLFDANQGPHRVYLAGIEAEIINYTNTYITVRAGNGNSLRGSVTIESTDGTFSGIGGNAWTYLPVLTTSHVLPSSGRNGTIVSIDITSVPSNFELQSVYFGDIQATIASVVNGVVTLYAGYSSDPSSMTDITLNFQDNVVLTISNSWSYQTPVSIMTNSDLIGYYNSLISLSGIGFQGGLAGIQVSSVNLAGFNTRIMVQTDTLIHLKLLQAFNSSGGNVTGPIVILSEDGAIYTSTIQNITFTYTQVQVTSVSPNQGQNGTRVTISGTGLLAGGSMITSFTLGGISASRIDHYDNSEIQVSAASFDSKTESLDIVYVMDSEAEISIPSVWSYLSPGKINFLTPSDGSKGTVVTIIGERMLGGGDKASVVYLNGVQAMEILLSHDKVVQVRAGESELKDAGQVTVIANTGALLTSNVSKVSFAYLEPGVVNLFNSTSVQYGTEVTIEGMNFHRGEGVSKVTIAGVEAAITSSSATNIHVIAQRPSQLDSFTGPLIVESNYGTLSQSEQNFTYLQEGNIYDIQPSQGQKNTEVVINGVRLLGGGTTLSSVFIAGVSADIMFANDTQVCVMAMENYPSNFTNVIGDIVLNSNTGAIVERINGWTYVQVGKIDLLTPLSGQYGTIVTITGERLTAGGNEVQDVYIGNTSALEVISSQTTEVVFRAGEPITEDAFDGTIMLVSSDGGELNSSCVWSYQDASEISMVSPINATGGSIVNISGYSLLGGGDSIISVMMAGIEVREILSGNETLIEVEIGFNPDGQEKIGDIRVEADTGALTILADGWVYVSECPVGQYGNSTDYCLACHPECIHCYGPLDFDCYDCQNFHINIDDEMRCVTKCPSLSNLDKECVDVCRTDQFEQISTIDNATYCINCDSQCDPNLSCTGTAPSQCTRCKNVKQNGVCIERCSVNYFTDNGTICMLCNNQCVPEKGCIGPESYHCNECLNVIISRVIISTDIERQVDECIQSCPSGYYTNMKQYCQPCHSLCLGGCVGPLASDCDQCANTSIIDSNGTRECIPQCNPDPNMKIFYQELSTGICKPCSSLCSTTYGCTGPTARDCINCLNFTGSNTNASEFLPKLDGECTHSCPNISYYIDLRSGSCEQCHTSCTNGCTGPTSQECNTDEPNTASTSNSSPFSAGTGTIVLVVVIIIVLFVVMSIIIVALFLRTYKKGEWKVNSIGDDQESGGGLELHSRIVSQELTETALNETDGYGTGSRRDRSGMEMISRINPVFLATEQNRSQEDIRGEASPPIHITSENDHSQTSEVYMEMDSPISEDLPVPDPLLQNTSDVPPPRPPKPSSNSNLPAIPTKSYKPPPPVPPHTPPPSPTRYDMGDVFSNEINPMSTQEEEFKDVDIFDLPLPPTVDQRDHTINRLSDQFPLAIQEENIYELDDSEAVDLYKMQHMQHRSPPPTPTSEQPPKLPARSLSGKFKAKPPPPMPFSSHSLSRTSVTSTDSYTSAIDQSNQDTEDVYECIPGDENGFESTVTQEAISEKPKPKPRKRF